MKFIPMEFDPMSFFPDPEKERRKISNAKFKAEGIFLPPVFRDNDKKEERNKK